MRNKRVYHNVCEYFCLWPYLRFIFVVIFIFKSLIYTHPWISSDNLQINQKALLCCWSFAKKNERSPFFLSTFTIMRCFISFLDKHWATKDTNEPSFGLVVEALYLLQPIRRCDCIILFFI